MKNNLFSIVFSFYILFPQNFFAQNNETYVKFSETGNKDEFKVEIFPYLPENLLLDLDNSHLSFVDNNFDSIDQGEWRIIMFAKAEMKFEVIFLCKNSQPPKFVKLQLVFVNKLGEIVLPIKTEYHKLILEYDFRIYSQYGANNSNFVYFNNTKDRNGAVFDCIGRKILVLNAINSGDLVDFNQLIPGMYFVKFFDIKKAEKICIK